MDLCVTLYSDKDTAPCWILNSRRAKWASTHISENFSMQYLHPGGAARAHASTLSSPFSLFVVSDICYAATFSLSLLFAGVWHILVVHFLYMPSFPSCSSSSPAAGPIKLDVHWQQRLCPSLKQGHPNFAVTWIKYVCDITRATLLGQGSQWGSSGSCCCLAGDGNEWSFYEVTDDSGVYWIKHCTCDSVQIGNPTWHRPLVLIWIYG